MPTVQAESGSTSSSHAIQISTLSSRPQLVSGGNVLTSIVLPQSLDQSQVRVTLNGQDIANEFIADEAAHSLVGLVTGLRLGENSLIAWSANSHDGSTWTRLTLTNHPITGPIISGPHQQPFICTAAQYKIYSGLYGIDLIDDTTLAPPTDAHCSVATKITYLYLPKGGTAFKPLPNAKLLPDDVSQVTTLAGATVNFVVRVETASIDRGIYQSAVLHDPTLDDEPSWRTPPRGWNRRLIVVEGAGCPGGWYHQGTAGASMSLAGVVEFSLFSPARLGEGYALFANTLQNASQNCNSVLAGEAAMMSKEHFIKTYGLPKLTVSAGASGGSYGSSQLADALPGLFDGILIAATFPDPLSIAFSGADGHLLTHYFATNPGALTVEQQLAVSGYKSSKAFIDAANQAGRIDPVPNRTDIEGYKSAVWNPIIPEALRYDPVKSRRGARPTLFDNARNIYGIDPKTGFARRPFDNVGVQYGLNALNSGAISPKEFLALNKNIGGYDSDFNYVQNRVEGDANAIRRAYESGLELSSAGGLKGIPIFDITGVMNEEGGYHYQWFHFAQRERLTRAAGDDANLVMWRGNPVPFAKAWSTFIAWVEAVSADTSTSSAREKTLRNKPRSAVDGCWSSPNEFIAERQSFDRLPSTRCNTLFPSFAFPRYVAGGPLAADIIKCSLKPLDRKDYKVKFEDADWKQLSASFPQGVCDWSKLGVASSTVKTWSSFGSLSDSLH
ncbi:MAG TPA: DUF6351 family protein [Steroidobacteraceae bacterium]|nr:DUF6351 family protein [Steroidobacteraceae bacterium]